jgi:hypothetical protein
MVRECRAKDKTTCRVHGHPVIDFKNGLFKNEPETTYTKNLKDSKTYKMMLSNAEEEAVREYCNQDYTDINMYLNNPDKDMPEDIKKNVALLDSALTKAVPLNEPRQLFRASSLKLNENGYTGFSSHDEANAYIDEHFPVGKVVEFKGFASTTETPHCLVDFCTPGYDSANERVQANYSREQFVERLGYENEKTGEMYDPSLGNIMYEFKTSVGAPLTDFGQTYAKKEQEVLLPRNKKFKVTKVHTNSLFEFNNEMVYETRKVKRSVTVIQLEEII